MQSVITVSKNLALRCFLTVSETDNNQSVFSKQYSAPLYQSDLTTELKLSIL